MIISNTTELSVLSVIMNVINFVLFNKQYKYFNIVIKPYCFTVFVKIDTRVRLEMSCIHYKW